MNIFKMKKSLCVLALGGVIIGGAGYVHSSNGIKEELTSAQSLSRSAINVVDIKSGETIFTSSSNNKNIGFDGMYRSGRAVVDIETREVIYTNKYNY